MYTLVYKIITLEQIYDNEIAPKKYLQDYVKILR